MPSVPLPFVVTLLLVIQLAVLVRRHGWRSQPILVAFLAVLILQTVVTGLRWSTGWTPARFIQPVVAAVIPALCFALVQDLLGREQSLRRICLVAAVQAAGLAALVAFWREPLDLVLLALFTGYGGWILMAAAAGPDGLVAVRLGDARRTHRAVVALGGFLIASALLDVLVTAGLVLGNESLARGAVGVFNLVTLGALAVASVMLAEGKPEATPPSVAEPPAPDDGPSEIDRQILARLEALMAERHLHRDPDLTLDRIARRLGLPARQVSGAINRALGLNMSQYVNGHRVEEAKRLLATSDQPVTEIQLAAGFQTKSNFNREFRRLAGCSPSEWREKAAAPAGGAVSAPEGAA